MDEFTEHETFGQALERRAHGQGTEDSFLASPGNVSR